MQHFLKNYSITVSTTFFQTTAPYSATLDVGILSYQVVSTEVFQKGINMNIPSSNGPYKMYWLKYWEIMATRLHHQE